MASIPIAPGAEHERPAAAPTAGGSPMARAWRSRAGADRGRLGQHAQPPERARHGDELVGGLGHELAGEAVQARDAALDVVAGGAGVRRALRARTAVAAARRTVAVTRSPRAKPWPSRSTSPRSSWPRMSSCPPSRARSRTGPRRSPGRSRTRRPRARARAPRPAAATGVGHLLHARRAGDAGPRDERLHRRSAARPQHGALRGRRDGGAVAGEHAAGGPGGRRPALEPARRAPRRRTSTRSARASMSMVTTSPSRTAASGPPRAASGATWPTMSPRVAPEKRPSVTSATLSPSPAPDHGARQAQHLPHPRAARRALVADDEHLAGRDRARAHRRRCTRPRSRTPGRGRSGACAPCRASFTTAPSGARFPRSAYRAPLGLNGVAGARQHPPVGLGGARRRRPRASRPARRARRRRGGRRGSAPGSRPACRPRGACPRRRSAPAGARLAMTGVAAATSHELVERRSRCPPRGRWRAGAAPRWSSRRSPRRRPWRCAARGGRGRSGRSARRRRSADGEPPRARRRARPSPPGRRRG